MSENEIPDEKDEKDEEYDYQLKELKTGQIIKIVETKSSSIYINNFKRHYAVEINNSQYILKSHLKLDILDKHGIVGAIKNAQFIKYWSVYVYTQI